jgi:hypothetical protein
MLLLPALALSLSVSSRDKSVGGKDNSCCMCVRETERATGVLPERNVVGPRRMALLQASPLASERLAAGVCANGKWLVKTRLSDEGHAHNIN